MTPIRMAIPEAKIAASFIPSSTAGRNPIPHISVCVCTYRRASLLKRLLLKLNALETGGLFTYSIIVTDNDEGQSGEAAVAEVCSVCSIPIKYCIEPRRSIALARNKAVENADGTFIALIDDDEFPEPAWLITLFRNLSEYKVDGVLGVVRRHFDKEPPTWFKKSTIYDRKVRPTGTIVEWKESRTGNALLKREIFVGEAAPFRPEFRAGEDQDFFWRKIKAGYMFIWSADAVVLETIPPARWSRRYILRKAMLQGATAALQPNCTRINIAKSVIAIPLYLLILPLALLAGHQYFMALMVKICDHSGKLFSLMGIDPIQEEYVSD